MPLTGGCYHCLSYPGVYFRIGLEGNLQLVRAAYQWPCSAKKRGMDEKQRIDHQLLLLCQTCTAESAGTSPSNEYQDPFHTQPDYDRVT